MLMQKEYYRINGDFTRGKNVFMELENFTIEELEQLANIGWDDRFGDVLYCMFMRCRKKKMNRQFTFNQENINAIVRLEQKFKKCFRQLKIEAENEFSRLLERKNNDSKFYFSVNGRIKIGAANSFLDLAHSFCDECFCNFTLTTHEGCGLEKAKRIFDFDTNYVDKIGLNSALIESIGLADCHLGYAFYRFYSESLFSLQDMLEIDSINAEITTHVTLETTTHFTVEENNYSSCLF